METCDINAALLNLVMKDQFSSSPNEDAASHLNTFIELCDMQKKIDVDNDIVKLKLFLFCYEIVLKLGFHLFLEIVLILGIGVKVLSLPSIFLPQKLFLLEIKS